MARGSAQLIVKGCGMFFEPILLFDFCERGTSERNNQKQNTVTLSARSGGELKLKTE
jgi:hypothetical protein